MFLFTVSKNLSMICYVEIDWLNGSLGFHNKDQYSEARMTRITVKKRVRKLRINTEEKRQKIK